MDALKANGNGVFFGNVLSRMHLAHERAFALQAVKAMVEIDPDVVASWISQGLDPKTEAPSSASFSASPTLPKCERRQRKDWELLVARELPQIAHKIKF